MLRNEVLQENLSREGGARRHQYMRVSNFSAFDLNSFHTLHDRFAPLSAPLVPEIECYAQCARHSRAIAGDLFFLVEAPSGQLIIALGHIALPGAAGFIAATGLAAGIRTLAAKGAEPREIVEEANRIFWEITSENSFAPLFCAAVDAGHRRLIYTQAGNQTCVIVHARDRRLQLLESNAAMLGLCLGGQCTQREVRFEPGDTLLALSEGIGEIAPLEMLRDALQLRTRDIPSHLIAATHGKARADRAVVAARLRHPQVEGPHREKAERLVLTTAA
jgi:serine phosphatase RsbU (regulator of sigma subunit)